MKQLREIVILTAIMWVGMPVAFSQDLHFSQFMNSPLLTNPANTGFMPEGDYRIGVNYRNQWSSVMQVPYKTMSAYGDVQVAQRDNSWLGVGGVLLRDVAGSGNLTSTKVYGSVAYHQMLGLGSLFTLGFNAGWANKRINTTNLTFPSQWNGEFFDSHNIGQAPQLDRTNISYLDLQAGLNYAYFPDENTYFNAGFSTMHINRPRESFFNEKSGIDNRIPARHTAFINGSFKLNDQVIINPNSYFSLQAKSYEWLIGTNVHYNLSGDGQNVLIAGLYYRSSDAVIPMVGLGLKDYVFTFTYDATVSTLRNYNNSRGALEFSLVKTGVIDAYRGTPREARCPTFKLY
jgi:type IX secretion system PorP/SprF family membrane protein